MGATNLSEYGNKIRWELADPDGIYSAAVINRAVAKMEVLLGRLIPKKNVVETTITIDRTAEVLTISSDTGTTTYKPIKYNSETVTKSGTTYIRDTDYTINYMTGVVTEIGSLLADGTYAITYKQDEQRLDISSLVSNPIKITRVEYPVGDTPPTYLGSFDLIEGYLILHKDTLLIEDSHLRIYYDGLWTAAAASTDGDYPTHLDDAVVMGAAGQCLLTKAEEYVIDAVDELLLVNTAADSMATPLAAIATALDRTEGKVIDAIAALDKVSTYLETNDTTDNAKDRLAEITDMEAYLRDMIIKLSDGSGALANANSCLDEVDTTDLGQATYGAEALLKTPVDSTLINKLTVGSQVAQKYALLAAGFVGIAGARVSAALGFIEEANTRLAVVRSYLEEAGGWNRIAEDFIAEATQRLGVVNAFLAEAAQRVAEVNAWAIQADRYAVTSREYLNIAGRYLASGQSKINEFYILLGFKPELSHVRASAGQPTQY